MSDGTAPDRCGGAPAGIRRLRADQPSKTVTGSAPRELAHPSEDRFLTLRECVRLQGFADGHVFAGSRSDQATLTGNAVPPPFAEAAARAVPPDRPRRPFAGGRIVEFGIGVPVLAGPVLAVVRTVVSRYPYGTAGTVQTVLPL